MTDNRNECLYNTHWNSVRANNIRAPMLTLYEQGS